MNKLRIITRHFISNYGSILQTIATQNFMKKFFDDVKIIDYINKKESNLNNARNSAKSKCNNLIKRLLFIILRYPDYCISSFFFRRFQKNNLDLTKRVTKKSDLSKLDKDALLCSGSDQLFGYMPYGTIDDSYYLNFASNDQICFSFSSSFGRNDFSPETKQIINKELKKYKLITIREKSSCEMLDELSIKSSCILDPTLMVENTFWYDYCKYEKSINEKYLLIYNLHTNKLLEETAKKISEELNLKIIRVSQYLSALRLKGKKKIYVSPQSFVNYFKNATFILTDSFHGMMFSVIFNKEFLMVNPGKTSSRIIDFLDFIKVENRFISKEKLEYNIENKIDFEKVNQIITDKRISDISIFEHFISNLNNIE